MEQREQQPVPEVAARIEDALDLFGASRRGILAVTGSFATRRCFAVPVLMWCRKF